jgi:type III restriction enzyme
MSFLYDTLVDEFGKRMISSVPVPVSIKDNLRPGFGQRPYQLEAFRRFILCETEDFPGKPNKPLHLLFNMATGSGKTLVMAGLMLYLYEKGYRNFLFFVNSNNIIQKTKDNFLNSRSSKYLFNESIHIDGKEVHVKEVENFEEADGQNINIKFTTIQKLHEDLVKTVKENCITFEDFKQHEIVIFADEAHHLNAATRNNLGFDGTWEGTVMEVLKQNKKNMLLEFTATMDFESREIVAKYKDKVLYKYDLSEFRNDKYSKEINLIRSHYNEEDRILQALMLNLYRQELATSQGINLKPVILFKAKKTIKESEENKEKFHKLIDRLSPKMVEKIKTTSNIPIVTKAFQFFENQGLDAAEIVKRTAFNFKAENCLSANESDTKDKKKQQEGEASDRLLNTLEEPNNPIRAIFAVQKLNEGWDVLNLFDIVRLYEDRDGKDGKPGKRTLSEAQLIGRGARYFPFVSDPSQDKYKRKFDDDIANDLKVLEELYYHTKEDSRYISELKKALIKSGVYEDEDNLVTKQLTLKPAFKQTDLYKTGYVFANEKVLKNFKNMNSFADFGLKKSDYRYTLSSGNGRMTNALGFEMEATPSNDEVLISSKKSMSEIDVNTSRYALSRNPFFRFDKIKHYFPNIQSLSEFIHDDNYLGGLKIIFQGTAKRLETISKDDHLWALQEMLVKLEMEIKANSTEYEGTDFKEKRIHQVFKDKAVRMNRNDERADGQEVFVANEPWYAYNANYGTSEEKKFVELLQRRFDALNQKFDSIYLLRNERELKIYDKRGNAFEPDFVMFCKQKEGDQFTYQVFIEPKGNHLLEHDKWKVDFLKEINESKKNVKIQTDDFLITAVPVFYNLSNENEFEQEFDSTLN